MSEPLKIGYAGTLMAHSPADGGKGFLKGITQWFWTFQPDNLNHTTRSGYFLFKGLQELKTKHGLSGKDIQIELWGNIDPGNQRHAEAFGVTDMVQISGFCSREETMKKLSACDVLFLPLESGKNGQRPLFIPGKLYEYLMVGKPILSLAGPSDCSEIIEGSGLGITADPNNSAEVAEKLLQLIADRHQLATVYPPNASFIEQYNFKHIAKKLSVIFNKVSEA